MIFVILVVAAILRLVNLDQSLWLDEAINVNVARSLSFKELVLNYSPSDFHPPLFHLILRAWILIFGSSEIAARVPSVILGVATVFVTYLIGKKLFETKTALVAATLIATAPLHIYYSQEARMYMLAAFLASLSVYFFISILEKDNVFRWFGFIIATVLLLYSDYLPYFLIPIYALFVIIFRKKIPRETAKAYLPAVILIFILLIPWLVIFPKQLNVGLSAAAASPAWSQVVGEPSLKNLTITFVKFVIGRISHDNNLIYALLFAPVGLYTLFLISLSFFRLSPKRAFLWFWFLGPIFLAFGIAFFVPVFAYFRFIFVLPAFYLILASGVITVNWVFINRLLLALILMVNLGSTAIYFTNPKFQRENWKEATAFILQNATPKTVVLFESTYSMAPFDYYAKGKIEGQGALSNSDLDPVKVSENVKRLTAGSDKIYLFQYLSEITDPQGLVFEKLTKLGFSNVATRDFENIGFLYEFRR